MPIASGEVAERAGARLLPASIRNDWRHRRVIARVPVWRSVWVVDLDLVVFLLAAGLSDDLVGVALRRPFRSNRIRPGRVLRRKQHRRHGYDRGAQDERRGANDIFHRILPTELSRRWAEQEPEAPPPEHSL